MINIYILLASSFFFLSVIIMYGLFDVNYFLRMAYIICWGRLFLKKQKIFEKTTNYGICMTTDVDIFLSHMNNARYVRELDFARSFFYDRCGLFWEIKKKGGRLVQGATSIRYRRAMPVFAPYKITTELVYWDDKSIYIQHEFVKLSDDFVHATVLSKQSAIGSDIYIPAIIDKIEPNATRPELSEELRLWLSSLKESSLKFKRLRDEKLDAATTTFLQSP